MSKKRIMVVIALVMAIAVSAAGGSFATWVIGYIRLSNSYAMTHCDILFLTSRSLIRNVDASGLSGLIDAIEDNGDTWDAIVRAWQLCSRADDKQRIARALGEWEAAKKRLEELRSSYKAPKGNNGEAHSEPIPVGQSPDR